MKPFAAASPESALVPRRRNGWEAADSGVLLWRQNFRPLLVFSGLPLCALALALWFADVSPPLCFLIVWWLKPLWDRLALHVVSVRFFEQLSPPRRLLKGLAETVFRGFPGDLLWRRFSPWRAARLPVRALENLWGKNYRRRISFLRGGGLGFSFFLTVFGLSLECAVLLGEAGFVNIITELLAENLFSYASEFFVYAWTGLFALWCLNLALLESLFVCMGFGLYVAGRVEVEGWDIQLLLRKAVRAEENRRKTRFSAKALVFCALLAALSPAKAAGQEADAASPPREFSGIPLADLKEILASPDFGGSQEGWGIRFKNPAKKEEQTEGFDFSLLPDRFKRVKEFLGYALRLILILGAGITVFFLIFRRYRLRGSRTYRPGRAGKMYGLSRDTAQTPRELLERARGLYARGEAREAWAFCLGAARAAYTASRGIVFPPDATEYNCLAIVRDSGEDSSGGFARLVFDWIQFAYAGRPPSGGSFEQALEFCGSLLGGGEPYA
ncbi:MAG: hypothetical protein LBQ57_12150 [Spirochaetales bacterium]|nr:hypothetical protein [Spirochaetales bacterium]